MVTDPQTNKQTHTHKQTRPITIHCTAKLSTHSHTHTLHFNSHFPGGSGLAGTSMCSFWISLKLRTTEACKVPIKSSPPTNQHPAVYRGWMSPNQRCQSITTAATAAAATATTTTTTKVLIIVTFHKLAGALYISD